MKLKILGIDQTIAQLAAASREGKAARKGALRDLGKEIAKELKAEAKRAEPLSLMSQNIKILEGKPLTPWGNSQWSTKVTRTGALIVTTRGANKRMEEGGEVTISDRFRKFLSALEFHLRKTTRKFKVKARPVFGPVYKRMQAVIPTVFAARFFYRLGRAMRRWRVE